MKKKLLAITLCLAMTVSAMAGCGSKQDAAPADTGSQSTDASAQSGGEKDAAPASSDSAAPADASGSGGGDLEGAHVLLLKAAGTFTTKIYEGYSDYMESHGYKTAEKSPTETTVAAQVQIIDELITQKVASITIATNGDAGYDEVFKKAKEAGVIINSVDSACNPEFRTIHVNQASSEALGAYQVRAGSFRRWEWIIPETTWRKRWMTRWQPIPVMNFASVCFPLPSTPRYRTAGSPIWKKNCSVPAIREK